MDTPTQIEIPTTRRKGLFIEQMVPKVKCSRSHLGKLIKQGKVTAEQRPTRSGRQAWYVTSTVEEVKAVLAAAGRSYGHHKTAKAKVKANGGGPLTDVLVFAGLDAEVRALLLQLAECDVETLQQLVRLVSVR